MLRILLVHPSFSTRWTFLDQLEEWNGVVNGKLWRLKQTNPDQPVLYYRSDSTLDCSGDPEELTDYFRLSIRLPDLIHTWRSTDCQFANRLSTITGQRSVASLVEAHGIRLLRQEPVETLFAFITSANNNVPRISRLLNALCEAFGEPVCSGGIKHWAFPKLHTLAQSGLEGKLRKMGFGYRSRYIPAAARWLLDNGGEAQLFKLRSATTEEAREFLLNIPGIGNKVADCICLCALDNVNLVPVDVHMLRAAKERGIGAALRNGTLSTKAYREVSLALSELWGEWAGWAQVIDFATRIRSNSLPRNRKRRRQNEPIVR
ncbi:hypothetical protein P879_10235 [Paragonimus westermani]|uniref:DNA-(apurinic or apyrimidinic site) lyase n=1 Tax=Paragonimus westermani TaxID=34504 RepID=A0A8T0D8Z6_9TREM|nr:hypothetical protein P879_10235 [Paragonimus westermani]